MSLLTGTLVAPGMSRRTHTRAAMTQATFDLFGPAPLLEPPAQPSRSVSRQVLVQLPVRRAAARPAAAGWHRWLRPIGQAVVAATRPAAETTRPAFGDVGFAIGWDHAHHRIVPPPTHMHAGHPVREGWDAGCARFGLRTLRPTSSVRRWLALRLDAWADGVAFDALHVTPHLLDRLSVTHCPITRTVLTEGVGGDDEGLLARVDTSGGYRPGNLAFLSRRALAARGGLGFREAIDHLAQLEADRNPAAADLGAAAWARLAVLSSFATPLPHDEAARLPLLVLPPPRVPVVNPAQALQVLLTTQLMRPGYARRLADLAARVASPSARRSLQVFAHTLLARRVALGASPGPLGLRHGLEDAWRHPLVNQRWQAFSLLMTPTACERLLREAVAPGDAIQLTPQAALAT